jgi:transposase
MNRTDAARIGGMDRQTLRDWVHRFNEYGLEGLKETWSKGNPPRLSPEQQAELAHLVEAGPDRAVQGVMRWRRVDLQRLIAERYGVTHQERTVGKLLYHRPSRLIDVGPFSALDWVISSGRRREDLWVRRDTSECVIYPAATATFAFSSHLR